MADQWTAKCLRWRDRVMYDHRYTEAERLALYDIGTRFNRVTGDGWARQSTTAAAMRISVATVHRAIKKAKAFGHLTVRFDGHALTNRVTPVFPYPIRHQRRITPVTRDGSPPSPETDNISSSEIPSEHSLQRHAGENSKRSDPRSAEGSRERKHAAVHNGHAIELKLVSALGEETYGKLATLDDQRPLLRLFRIISDNDGRLTGEDIEAARAAARSAA